MQAQNEYRGRFPKSCDTVTPSSEASESGFPSENLPFYDLFLFCFVLFFSLGKLE